MSMYKRTPVLLTMAVILFLSVSCRALPEGMQKQTDKQTQTEANTEIEPDDTIPYDAAFQSSRLLIHMDDLKAINMAANYLKEQGETVSFHETYIEYHDAGETASGIILADGKTIEYIGDYLEVRLFQSDDPVHNPCQHCTVVYISRDGKILGQNKICNGTIAQENTSE